MRRDRPWFATWSQAGKQPDPVPAWFAPAKKIVAEFEGLRLNAYLCPAGVPTIGYGHTGAEVQIGQTISQQQADELLRQDLQRFADGLHRLIPSSTQWGASQQAALISWAFNVGLGAVEDSTLRKRINNGEAPILVVPQELPKWNKANGAELAGLTRRRKAEVALFTGTTPAQQQAPRFSPSSPFNTKITPHITYGELTLYEERRRFINQGQCDIAVELCTFLEKARAQFGNKPVIITSGHRPEQVNKAVGGASNSEHLYKPGCGAIDWYLDGIDIYTLQDWCKANWPYSTGLGAPKNFIHSGIRAERRKLVWTY
jgi:lysozyme